MYNTKGIHIHRYLPLKQFFVLRVIPKKTVIRSLGRHIIKCPKPSNIEDTGYQTQKIYVQRSMLYPAVYKEGRRYSDRSCSCFLFFTFFLGRYIRYIRRGLC